MGSWGGRKREKGPFRSKLEAFIAAQLKRLKIKYKYEPHKLKYLTRVRSGTCGDCKGTDVYQVRSYLPDFQLANESYIEGKGYFTASERAKLLSILKANPNIKLRMVFGADNKIKEGYRYSDWCRDHGVSFSIKRVDPSWAE